MKKLAILMLTLFMLSSVTLAQENELSGTDAGGSLTTGTDNALYGDYAGQSLTTGSGNVFDGTYAGRNMTTTRGSIIMLMSKKALQTGTSKADSLALSFYDFELTAAADSTFGTAVQLLGSTDTPIVAGHTFFDIHGVVITTVDSNALYKLRLAWGASSAIGVAAGDYTDIWVWSDTTNPQNVSNTELEVQIPTLSAGTLLWASIANAAGGQTMSLKFTLLEHN